MRLRSGRNPTLSTVVLETSTSGNIVVEILTEVATVVETEEAVVSHSSPHFSKRRKKTATPIMEMPMNSSEMTRIIFLPNLSMTSVVASVPTTCTVPISIVLTHASIVVPAL